MNIRPVFLFALALGLLLSVQSHPKQLLAQTVINLTGCGQITASGSYRLANNISTSSSTCLDIKANNVTIDGNGKTITMNAGGDSLSIKMSDPSVVAQRWHNISVSNFSSNGSFATYDNVYDITLTGLTLSGVSVFASDSITITNSTINGTVSVTNNNSNNALDLVFTGNTVTGSGDRFAYFTGDAHVAGGCDTSGYTIDNNIFTDTINVTTNNPVNVFLSCTQNGSFNGNTVISTGQATGVLIRDGWSNNSFANNTIHVNRSVDDTRAAIAIVSGSLGGAPDNNIYSNNTVIADNSKALLNYIGTQGTVFQNNLFVSNSTVGSSMTYTTTSTSSPLQFLHNTVIERGTGSGLTFASDGLKNINFHDNIIVTASGSVIGGNTSTRSNFTTNHNLYQNRSGAANFSGIGNFNTWRTLVNETSSLEANPLFVDYTNGNYHLQAGSPAAGVGTGGSDIGAFALSGGSCTEVWSCSGWGSCTNGSQSRTCTDANACGTIANRPALSQSCSVACTESWSCGAWSTCSSGNQSRTCSDANSCGTTTTRPALSQACSNGPQCGIACNGCVANQILATACTTSQRQCDGTNAVNDIRLNTNTITGGEALTVEVDYSCYATNDDNLALWYYNGTTWRIIQNFPTGSLTGCNNTAGTDGTKTITFTPDNTDGTHYVRAIEAADAVTAASSSCPNILWGNIDDMSFTVNAIQESCNEDWTCGAWSSCTNGSETRSCTDANSCGTTLSRPPVTQSCIMPDTTAPDGVSNLSPDA